MMETYWFSAFSWLASYFNQAF